MLLGDRDEVEFRHGVLQQVYNDNRAEIRIVHETMHGGDTILLDEPYNIFVERDIWLFKGKVGDAVMHRLPKTVFQDLQEKAANLFPSKPRKFGLEELTKLDEIRVLTVNL